jgi:ABC-type phosphate transport system substrate-binding protein
LRLERTPYTKSTMKSKGIVFAIVLLGVLGAAYRLLNRGVSTPSAQNSPPQNNNLPQSNNPNPSNNSNPSGVTDDITILTSSSKEKLIRALCDSYAQQTPGVQFEIHTKESREGLQAILSGTERPNLYSPSDSPLTESLNTAWKKAHNGEALINTGSPDFDLIFAETPCVFLTTEAEATALEPLLTGPKPFAAVLKQPKINFSLANPLSSASGLLALGRIAQEVPGGVSQLKNRLFYDTAARNGSSQLLEAYLSELKTKGTSPRAFIVAYENKAIAAQLANADLHLKLIYPKEASVAEQRISIVGSNASEQVRAFLRFLKTPEAQQLLISEGYHPKFVRDTLTSPAYKTSPPQPYNELMNVAQAWSKLQGDG